MSDIVVQLHHVDKAFKDISVLKDFNLTVNKGEFVIITGPSGCGKSTLLNLIGLLETCDRGDLILFGETNVKPFSKKAEKLLKNHIGYVFQNYALIEHESINYNFGLIMEKKLDKKVVEAVLQKVGLAGYEHKKIYSCSGGEQQRIALARLYLKPCDLILADEPTGSLDIKNRDHVMEILQSFHKEGKTILMVTHDQSLYQYADRVIELNAIS